MGLASAPAVALHRRSGRVHGWAPRRSERISATARRL